MAGFLKRLFGWSDRAGTGAEANEKRIEKVQKKRESKLEQRRAGRNEPCPCGSGRKYERCCGPKMEPSRFQKANVATEGKTARISRPTLTDKHVQTLR